MLTFRQLEAFKAVVDTGSVVRAAELIGRSQPAVSRLLSDLESAVGYRLFERRRGLLTPLDEAWELYAEVDRSFVGLGRIRESAERIGRRKMTVLRIAALPGFTSGPIAGVVTRLLEEHPDLFLALEARTRPQILDGVADGLHDIGLASMPIESANIGVRPLLKTECVCLVPVDHPLGDREVITPHDLDGANCIMGADRTPLRLQLGRVFDAVGSKPNVRVEVTTAQSGIALAAQGVGITLGWGLTIDYSHADRVRVVRFRPRIPAELAVVYRANRPPDGIAAKFIDAYAQAAEAWPSRSP